MRVLVVDDEPTLRRTIEHTLTQRGYTVVLASNGEEGLEALQEEPVDLVLTDILMPEHDGFSMIERIRAADPEVPIIAMSAMVGPSGRQQALRLGATLCVTKPLDLSALLRIVQSMLQPQAR